MPSTELVRQDLPDISTELPGPRARAIVERDHAVLSPSYTRCYPLVVARGHGAMVEDVDGNRFLDFNAGIAVCSTGHCHPRVVEAIRKQAGELIHMSGTDFYYESMVTLAERLAASAPGSVPRRVYFGNSGTEAVEAAMKLARYNTGREKFIAFFGGFHGRTMGSLSLTGSKVVQRRGFGPLVPGVSHVPYPYPYRFAGSAEECANASLAAIEQLFRSTVPADEVAAFVVEPIQGEGGYVVPPTRFFDGLQELAKRHGILIVADEVQCGMGRSGRLVGVGALRPGSRHHDQREGHRQWNAVGRDDCAGGVDELGAGRACVHIWRQPGLYRVGAGYARSDRGEPAGEFAAHG
jgi:4-aminobutyrate aminotransferase